LTSLRYLYQGEDFEFESQVYARDGERRSLYRVLLLFLLRPGTQDKPLVYVCTSLFEKFPRPEDLLNLQNTEVILRVISPVGHSTHKLKLIRDAAIYCIQNRDRGDSGCARLGKRIGLWRRKRFYPNTLEYAMAYGCGRPGLPIDGDSMRVLFRTSDRIDRSSFDYGKTGKKLKKALNPKEWIDVHEILRLHGLVVCQTYPRCHLCPIEFCRMREKPFDEQTGIQIARQEAKRILDEEWKPWRNLACVTK